MSGETEREVSGWTTDTLKELHDREIASDRRFGTLAVGAVCVVVALGWHEIQRRLITLNHAHEQHEQTLARSVTSDKYESDKKAEETRITGIEASLIASAQRERSAADEASRLAGARTAEHADRSGDSTARRQTIALVLSTAAIIATVVGLVVAYSRSHPDVVVPTPTVVTVTTPG